MKFLFAFLTFFLTYFLYAQPEGKSTNKLYIAPKEDANIQLPKSDSWLKIYSDKKKVTPLQIPEKGVDFTGENTPKYVTKEFTLPTNAVKFSDTQEQNLSAFKGDQDYGDFSSNGKMVGIFCRDYGAIDGDLVDIFLNDELIMSNVYLSGDFKKLNIPLKIGFNKIEIKAVNQGLYGPNTAEFRVYDEQNNELVSETWALLTGYKARFVIIKDK
ncbi:MAG: hypothetical protein Q3983_02610 [Capnocytophaga sp.]|nr:hypothetical protein [Capnocytophaga sp.]